MHSKVWHSPSQQLRHDLAFSRNFHTFLPKAYCASQYGLIYCLVMHASTLHVWMWWCSPTHSQTTLRSQDKPCMPPFCYYIGHKCSGLRVRQSLATPGPSAVWAVGQNLILWSISKTLMNPKLLLNQSCVKHHICNSIGCKNLPQGRHNYGNSNYKDVQQ